MQSHFRNLDLQGIVVGKIKSTIIALLYHYKLNIDIINTTN